ncbi:hypothetical protein [Lentibacillus salinarum]|uniref:Uncharacterized protein n=1 Tax=Lentibacillus salinarum TaxID=446820 RepID=A0ABW3ZUB4_9BACI
MQEAWVQLLFFSVKLEEAFKNWTIGQSGRNSLGLSELVAGNIRGNGPIFNWLFKTPESLNAALGWVAIFSRGGFHGQCLYHDVVRCCVLCR